MYNLYIGSTESFCFDFCKRKYCHDKETHEFIENVFLRNKEKIINS